MGTVCTCVVSHSLNNRAELVFLSLPWVWSAKLCRRNRVTRLHFLSCCSSINYPCWQTAWCGCGTGFADAAVGTCPGICSNTRVSQSPSWWPQPWCWFPLSSPPTTRYLSSPLESGISADKLLAKFSCSATHFNWRVLLHTHSLLLKFKSSWIVAWSNPLHCETIHSCSILLCCPTGSNFCSHPPPQSFPQPDPRGMMSGILCECVSWMTGKLFLFPVRESTKGIL